MLLVQEACRDGLGDQVFELGEALGLSESATFYPPGHEEGIAVLSALPLERSRAELLPHTAGPQRALLCLWISRPFELEVICTHLSFRPEHDRRGQLEAVLAAARASRRPVVIGGDFNLSPQELPESAGGFSDALAGIDVSWPMVSLEEFASAWRRRVGSDLPADFDAAPRRLDHLLCRGLCTSGRGRVIVPGFDHALVWADFAPLPGAGEAGQHQGQKPIPAVR